MDDNIWEYPFGDLDDDEELFFQKPDLTTVKEESWSVNIFARFSTFGLTCPQ